MAVRRINTNACTRQINSSNIVYLLLMDRDNKAIDNVARSVNTHADVIIPRMTCPALMLAASRNESVIGRM